MILRSLRWILLVHLVSLSVKAEDRTYDNNDWVPITPSSSSSEQQVEITERKATGRVLNLDAPAQKFFPDDYNRKKRPPQQYFRETIIPKHHVNHRHKPKINQPYKYETAPKYVNQGAPPLQYFTNKEVKLPLLEQPPPLPQQFVNQAYVLPPPQITYNQANLNSYEQYAIPINTSLYQNANPTSIGQELLGAIQNTKLEPVSKPQEEQNQTVQLLYVPLENLKSQIQSQGSQHVYQQAEPPRKQQQLVNIEQDFIQQALQAHKLQEQFQAEQPLIYQNPQYVEPVSTTQKPKKRKPHQPPLAVYMGGDSHADVSDVLGALKNAKTISVQDTIQPNSPKIFVGPSTLDAPEGYTKFPLPYLNSINGNRVERKIDQLPFFVAPLSYKTPPGYSKIPLPSPHVGSVVVNNKNQVRTSNQNQIQDFSYVQPQTPTKLPDYNQYNQENQFAQQDNRFNQQNNQYLQQDNQFNQQNNQFNQQNNQNQYSQNPQVPNVLQYQQENNQEQNYQTDQYNPFGRPQNINGQELKALPPTQFGQSFFEDQDFARRPQEAAKPQYYDNEDLKTRQPQEQVQYNQAEVIKTPQRGQFNNYFPPTQAAQTTPATRPTFNYNPVSYSPEEVSVTPKTTPSYVEQEQRYSTASPTTRYNQNSIKQSQQFINPLELAINQYELQQINSQLESQEPKYSTSKEQQFSSKYNAPSSTANYETTTTLRPVSRNKPSRRRKPSTTTTTTTVRPTENYEDLNNNHYTVLEEFTANPSPTSKYQEIEQTYQQYTTQATYPTTKNYEPTTTQKEPTVENIPVQVFKLPLSDLILEDKPAIEHKLNQELMDQQILKIQKDSFAEEKPRQQFNLGIEHPLKQKPQKQQEQFNLGVQHPLQSALQQTEQSQEKTRIEPLVHNRGNSFYQTEPAPTAFDSGFQPNQGFNPFDINQNFYIGQPQQPQQTEEPKEVLPVVSNLQEQAVRSLLVPNLLVPTTEQEQNQATGKYEVPSTEDVSKVVTTEATRVETTTRARTRGRVRGGNTSRYSTPTAAPTRRTVTRSRRPIPTRTTTERTKTSTEYSSREVNEQYSRKAVPNNNGKQRFRTRGRPSNAITERVSQSTTENEINSYQRPEPNSYMQFDSVIDNQKIITMKPEDESIKDYHQVYSLPSQTVTEDVRLASPEPTDLIKKQVVDVQITHPITEAYLQPTPDSQFIRSNANVQSGGVLFNNRETTTTERTTVKSRGRTRGRSRFPSTTVNPRQRTTTEEQSQAQNSEEEFYGFIRKPNFQANVQTVTQQPIQLYSSTYQSTSSKPLIVVTEDSSTEAQTPVHFVGRLMPKYQTTERTEAETTRPKVRGRVRIPTRTVNTQGRKSINDVSGPGAESATRRASTQRSRGRTHYKAPEGSKKQREEEISEDQNYPASFFKNRKQAFQINMEDDQSAHASLYQPKFSKPEEWIETSNPNKITDNDRKSSTDEPQALLLVGSTTEKEESATEMSLKDILEDINGEIIDETTTLPQEEVTIKKKGRRRGVWKLVKHRPLDNFETAESQNYKSVLNTFDSIEKNKETLGQTYDSTEENTDTPEELLKLEATTTEAPSSSSTTTESGLMDKIYEMFGIGSEGDEVAPTEYELPPTTTTTVNPTFPEELTEEPTTLSYNLTSTSTPTEAPLETTLAPQETTLEPKTEAPKSTFDVAPWKMREVKTSTSTEVSHETEICYKGKCVKSKERKTRA